MITLCGRTLVCSLVLLVLNCSLSRGQTLTTADDRLVVELVAEHPDIVTPTGVSVDERGRVFVAESHTHFRPDGYSGPAKDRILVFTAGRSAQDKPTIFHEGLEYLMDIEWHTDGFLYAATRSDIYRMRDADGDDAADDIKRIVAMETTGSYPHNGLSGLAFDFTGRLHFGLGENSGHDYVLIGTDGRRWKGGGEGGTTYCVNADGSELTRTSTGWWNPFGMCVDSLGRIFGTDNDPGASPPCRLIQVVGGADYGYERRYGTTGLHPLIHWKGDFPGTLPMVAGTGEAPCAIVEYDSDALPAEYRGHLLVACWADHRIEHFALDQSGDRGLVSTHRRTLVSGDNEFRPVGLDVAPDGTVYISDWVSSSYMVHQQGRLWRIRPREMPAQKRPTASAQAIDAVDRPVREAAAKQLARTETGRDILREKLLTHEDVYVRSAALQALRLVQDERTDYTTVAGQDPAVAVRVLALEQMIADGAEPEPWTSESAHPALRAVALAKLDARKHQLTLANVLNSEDPLLYHAALQSLARLGPEQWDELESFRRQHPLATLLATRRSAKANQHAEQQWLKDWLEHPEKMVRLAAVEWIADEQLHNYRSRLEQLLNDEQLAYETFLAVHAAIDRLEGNNPSDRPSDERLLEKVLSRGAPVRVRSYSLRLLDPQFDGLRLKDLQRLLQHPDDELRLEALRTIAEHPDEDRYALLTEVLDNREASAAMRASAVSGLATAAERYPQLLIQAAGSDEALVAEEALRGLLGVELTEAQRLSLEKTAEAFPERREAVTRLLEAPFFERPPADEVHNWLPLLAGKGNVESGRLIFFNRKVGMCYQCHEMQGRGTAVGPALTNMSDRVAAALPDGKQWLLEAVLQPSKEMAPEYRPWMIVTTDGRTLQGLPRRKGADAEAYLGLDGKEFSVRKATIAYHREMQKSLMPDNLLQSLTAQEIRDLIAFISTSTRN